MIGEDDLLNRVSTVRNLRPECFKYLEASSSEMLTQKIIFAIAKLTAEKLGPVKLSEIGHQIFGMGDKAKQDLVRLTIEKTLLKCGLVEKLHYAANDVRYILTAYRFQKVRKIESFRGDNAEPTGEILELPRSLWPLPDSFLILISKKNGYIEALKRIGSDYDGGKVPQGRYEELNRRLSDSLDKIIAKLDKYSTVEEILAISKEGSRE